MHQPARADNASGDGAEVLVGDGLHNLLLHLLSDIGIVNHAEVIGQQVGGDGVVAIVGAVGVENVIGYGGRAFLHDEISTVESLFGCGDLFPKPLGILLQILYGSIALHHPANIEIVGCGDEGNVGLTGRILTVNQFLFLRRYAPVGILPTMDEPVLLIPRLQVY